MSRFSDLQIGIDDIKVGYDIYCTNWDGLRYDSACHHAHLSKLMDSEIVYIKNQEAYEDLCRLREQTKAFLCSEERFDRVNELIGEAIWMILHLNGLNKLYTAWKIYILFA